MKLIYTLIITAFIVCACQKEIHRSSTGFSLLTVRENLKDSMQGADYVALDFTRAVYNHVDSAGLYFLRIPFKEKTIAEKFVLVKMTAGGNLKEGKIIQLDGGVRETGGGAVKAREWEGSISISSLNRQTVLNSFVHHGYIEAFHPQASAREAVLQAPDLPEVVVVAYVHNFDGADFSTWLWLNSFFYPNNYDVGGGGGNNGGVYYGFLDGYGGGGSGIVGDTGGGGSIVTQGETILVDVDTYVDHPAIDVEQYLKCFDAIPDVGAQCEIGIYADIPVDSDPNKIFDFSTGSPGHTFIQIKKTNGSQGVVQNIGFYPKTGWKTGLTNAPIDAKFVDDGMHEFNAGYTKILTADELKSVLTEIRYLKNMQYDIDNYNCTDWALAVFNKQGYGLDIPLYDIPGNLPSTGTSMPQGIYNKLKEMKQNNDTHADKIQIGFVKAWVANSNGSCN